MGCCSSTVLSKSPCSQNSAATESATWVDTKSYTSELQNFFVLTRLLHPDRLTLLWTSHGLVMADRSQAVIIMALLFPCKQSHIHKTKKNEQKAITATVKTRHQLKYLFFYAYIFVTHCDVCAHITISFLVVSRERKSTHFFSSSYVSERSTIFWNIVLFLVHIIEVILKQSRF